MIQFSPHLSIGDSKDMYNTLTGIYEKHGVDSIIDCSPSSYSKKWHKDKSISLKKISIDIDNLTKQKINNFMDFIVDNHKNHKHVLIGNNKGYEYAALYLMAFLLLKKDKTVEESIESVSSVVRDFKPNIEFIEAILKWK